MEHAKAMETARVMRDTLANCATFVPRVSTSLTEMILNFFAQSATRDAMGLVLE